MGCLGTPRDWKGKVATPFTATTTMSPCMLSDLPREKRPPRVSQYLFSSSKAVFPPEFIMVLHRLCLMLVTKLSKTSTR